MKHVTQSWKKGRIVLFLLFILLLIFSAVTILAQDEPLSAVAQLQDTQGKLVGSVFFTQTEAEVWVVVQVNALPPGFHGFHVHAVGQCDATGSPVFGAAGAHLGSEAASHPGHSGDLPVLLVNQDGIGVASAATDRFTVSDLLDGDGSAVIIHANPDNYANIPERYGAVDEETLNAGDGGDRIACGVVQTIASAATAEGNLRAVEALPLDQLPAKIRRDEDAERGTLVLTLKALGGVQVVGQVTSADAGEIGEVHREGDTLVFTFTEITYDVAPITLPGGIVIGPQSIRLDPSQTSTMRMDMTTGEITRDFHWLQTATDVLYDGEPTIVLGDTAKAKIAEITDLGGNVYTSRMLTHWKSSVTLQTWTIGGVTLPSGELEATADFDGIYILDFNK